MITARGRSGIWRRVLVAFGLVSAPEGRPPTTWEDRALGRLAFGGSNGSRASRARVGILAVGYLVLAVVGSTWWTPALAMPVIALAVVYWAALSVKIWREFRPDDKGIS